MHTNATALFLKLNTINIMPEALKNAIAEMLTEETIGKKQLILKAGQVARRIYFIKQGFVRSFYTKNGQTYTNWFMDANDIIISVYSFFSQNPSFESIEVLEDCVLQSITWDQLQQLYQNFPSFNVTGRIITEQYYIRSEKRQIDLQTLPAAERYQKLLAEYPAILQQAALGHIASYLGIKQETLSRIRAQNRF